MRKFIKSTTAFLLSFIILFSMTFIPEKVFAKEGNYKTGEIINFGSYPQSLVKDLKIINELNAIDKNWVSYDYYTGTGITNDGSMTKSDYMRYADVVFKDEKYRGVFFSKYRKFDAGFTADTSTEKTFQYENGYEINNIYWFKYEPLKWKILDAEKGLVVCDQIIDSQAYEDFFYLKDGKSYNSLGCTARTAIWETCSLREWLNNCFLYCAFSDKDIENIDLSKIENKSSYDSQYDSNETTDRVFLLAYWDVYNAEYGFNTTNYSDEDILRVKKCTDYAKCQGVSTYNDNTQSWWLRTLRYTNSANLVGYGGTVSFQSASSNHVGIVPALVLKNLGYDSKEETSGSCGNNVFWNYDCENNKLSVYGSGKMFDFDLLSGYGWYSFKNDISYVEVSDGIENVGTNAFNGCTELKEVFLGKDVTVVGENAFNDCTNLSIVSVTSDKFTAEDAFKNNNSKLTFVISKGNNDAENFAKNNGYSVITASYSADEHTIEFKGNTIVYKGLQYNYLTNFVNEYSNAEYLHFDRLEFDGVKPDVIIIEDCENIASDVKNFALNDLYVSLKVIVGGHEEQITFEKMFELLESGNYDAFKLKFRSESGETEETFFEKIAEFFEEIYTSALRVITKAINFVVGIFKKK